MRGLPKRDTVVGWAFVALGYFLIRWHDPAIEDLLHARAYSLLFFPNHFAAQCFFMGFFILARLPAAGLCFVTGWGVGHQRTWSWWTGLMPCLYLLLGLPYLTVVGAVGLCYLWMQPTVKRRALTGAEFWNPRRMSGWMITASILGWFVARLAFRGLQGGAHPVGLPVFDSTGPGLVPFLFLVWIHVALHECGHALAAVSVGFRLKALAIGPLVFSMKAGTHRVRFDWRGLLLLGGHTGAVPVSPRGLRVKQAIVIAAGPFTSLLAGGVLLGVSFLVPGTAMANLWPLVAMGSVIGFYVGLINLLPLGYCDGTMLFHLLLCTRRGEELMALWLRGTNPSAGHRAAPDYDGDVSEQRGKLRRLLDSPAPDPVQLGRQYIALASFEQAAQYTRDAEQHAAQGLALLSEGAAPDSEAAGWECLQFLRMARFDHAGAMEAYQKALTAFGLLRNGAQDLPQRMQAGLRIAGLHVRARAWAEALEETAAALALCPEDEQWRMWKGMLLSFRARALLQTGSVDAGPEATREAAGILRAQSDDVLAPHYLVLLGESLWNAGQAEGAISLMAEGIGLLEARGAVRLAAAIRLYLAEVLRIDGRAGRAACVLPPPERIEPVLRRQYHARRGAIRRSGGKLRDAIDDLSAVVAMSEQGGPGDEVALAVARGLLAGALAEAGDLEQAEPLATQAYETLASAGHPDFSAACITLAVVGWRKNGSAGDYVEAAIRGWNAAPLLFPADKARELEAAARSLESAGLAAEAAECRAAAAQHWQSIAAAPQEALVTSGS